MLSLRDDGLLGPDAIAAARPLVVVAGLPGVRSLNALVVGRETHALIDARLRGAELRDAA